MNKADDFLVATNLIVRNRLGQMGSDFSIRYFELLEAFLSLSLPSAPRLIDGYRRLLAHPEAAREKLLFMAAEEACGASILRFFLKWAEAPLQADLELHANDEDRHAKMLSRAAHHFAPEEQRYRTISVDPANELVGATWGDFPNCLWNVHLNEISAFSSYYAMQALANDIDSEAARRLSHVLSSLMTDELGHIAYTARYLEIWINQGVLSWGDLAAGMTGYEQIIEEGIGRIERSLNEPCGYPFDERLVLVAD
jgi:hypothetical protein